MYLLVDKTILYVKFPTVLCSTYRSSTWLGCCWCWRRCWWYGGGGSGSAFRSLRPHEISALVFLLLPPATGCSSLPWLSSCTYSIIVLSICGSCWGVDEYAGRVTCDGVLDADPDANDETRTEETDAVHRITLHSNFILMRI